MTGSTGPVRRRCEARHPQKSGGAPGLNGAVQTGGRSQTQRNDGQSVLTSEPIVSQEEMWGKTPQRHEEEGRVRPQALSCWLSHQQHSLEAPSQG